MRVSGAEPQGSDDLPIGAMIRFEVGSWRPSPRLAETWPELHVARPVSRQWRPPRLALAVTMTLVGALTLNAVVSRSMDPRDWLRSAQSVVHQLAPQVPEPATPAASHPHRTGNVILAGDGAVPAAGVPAHFGTAPPRVAADADPTVGVSVKTGPGAGDTSQGVSVASDPRGHGGMTGAIGEGPLHANGTVDGAGMRGCLGSYSDQAGMNVCGSANLPVTAPVPPLPAPVVPNVVSSSPTP